MPFIYCNDIQSVMLPENEYVILIAVFWFISLSICVVGECSEHTGPVCSQSAACSAHGAQGL